MINPDVAKDLVQAYLDQPQSPAPNTLELVILDAYTREEEFGWVFFYDSKRHHETGDFQDAIVGNAPIIVNKHDGSLHVTGTAYPIDKYIQHYQDQLDEASERWGLAILDRGDDFLATLRTVRTILGLSMQEVTTLQANIPGVVRCGSRTQLHPLVTALQAQGVQAELQDRVSS